MPRIVYQTELERLRDAVLALGNMTQQAISCAMASLETQDIAAAQRLVADDRRINAKRFAIEQQALALLAMQAPVAVDPRFIAAVLHIITELERMADHAAGVAKVTLLIADEPWLTPPGALTAMAETAQGMLGQALEAFGARDAPAPARWSPRTIGLTTCTTTPTANC